MAFSRILLTCLKLRVAESNANQTSCSICQLRPTKVGRL